MEFSARAADVDDILDWRDAYRSEMDCQIIHDSIHYRPGWSQEYVLRVGTTPVGYGSVAVGGPWRGQPTVYEIYIDPLHRSYISELFIALQQTSRAVSAEVQSNDSLAMAVFHRFARDVSSLKILFEDDAVTSHAPVGATFRTPTSAENPQLAEEQLQWHGIVEIEGRIAATGGILFHYNPPYGDIFMEVAEPFRRRGIGSFIVQELKRVCYEGGHIPAARCNPGNLASRRTLEKAGFAPCGHMLGGTVPHAP